MPNLPWALRIAVLMAAMASTAAAQQARCHAELTEAAAPHAQAPARAATAVARAALEALEPAFPATRTPAAWSDPDATWLDRRGRLPGSWNEDELSLDAFAALLRTLQAPYRVEPVPLPRDALAASDPEQVVAALVDTAARAVGRAAATVRPLTLIASEDGDRQQVAIVTVIWNWTPHPRLLAYRSDDWTLGEGSDPAPVLDRIAGCAWRPEAWMITRVDAAVAYYTGASDAGLRVVGSDQDGTADGPARTRFDVPDDERVEVLRFRHERLAGASVASLEFTGGGPGVWEVLNLLGSVRTNLGLFDVPRYLELP